MEGGGRYVVMLTFDREGRQVSRFIIQAYKQGVPRIRLGDVVERPQAISVEWGPFCHVSHPKFYVGFGAGNLSDGS